MIECWRLKHRSWLNFRPRVFLTFFVSLPLPNKKSIIYPYLLTFFCLVYSLSNEKNMIYPHLLGGLQIFANLAVISKQRSPVWETTKLYDSWGDLSKKPETQNFLLVFHKFPRFGRLAINFPSCPLLGLQKYCATAIRCHIITFFNPKIWSLLQFMIQQIYSLGT